MAGLDVTTPSGQRGCSRWMVYAGAAGVMLLMLVLFAGTRVVERGLHGVALRACARIAERLPGDLPAGERQRTERNLRQLAEQLRRGRVDGAVVSGFLSRASAALEDGRLTVEEVAELNRFLDGQETVVEPTPAPSPLPLPAGDPAGETPPAGTRASPGPEARPGPALAVQDGSPREASRPAGPPPGSP